jgi:hypothetical protein
MKEENKSNGSARTRGLDSYQPVDKTYSAVINTNRNYQPLIPTALANGQARPPTGDSGVPPPQSNNVATPKVSAKTGDQNEP